MDLVKLRESLVVCDVCVKNTRAKFQFQFNPLKVVSYASTNNARWVLSEHTWNTVFRGSI